MRRIRFIPTAALILVLFSSAGFTLSGYLRKFSATVRNPTDATVTAVPLGAEQRKEYILAAESFACEEVQSHTASARAIMDNYDKTALFSDACFLHNQLVTIWEKDECQTSPPAPVDCCAETAKRYWQQYNYLLTSIRWNTCSYWLYTYACPRMNAYKQQCDVMQCSQDCDWTYDCSANGFYNTFNSVPDNAQHPAETASCLRDAGFK